jgi:hypothetical protein
MAAFIKRSSRSGGADASHGAQQSAAVQYMYLISSNKLQTSDSAEAKSMTGEPIPQLVLGEIAGIGWWCCR